MRVSRRWQLFSQRTLATARQASHQYQLCCVLWNAICSVHLIGVNCPNALHWIRSTNAKACQVKAFFWFLISMELPSC